MINHRQLRELVIQPALNYTGLYSENDEELLIMTCAQETLGGNYLKQLIGPAVSIYCIEPDTYEFLWDKYLTEERRKQEIETYVPRDKRLDAKIATFIKHNIGAVPDINWMIWHLGYATIMARVYYLCRAEHDHKVHTPDKSDTQALAEYYKQYYNTMAGKATVAQVIDNYHLYLKGR